MPAENQKYEKMQRNFSKGDPLKVKQRNQATKLSKRMPTESQAGPENQKCEKMQRNFSKGAPLKVKQRNQATTRAALASFLYFLIKILIKMNTGLPPELPWPVSFNF